MKLKLTLFITLFQFIANSQNYKITYSFSMNIDADTIKNPSSRHYYKNHFFKEVNSTFGVLWANTNAAYFEQEGNLKGSSYSRDYLSERYISNTHKKLYKPNSDPLGLSTKYHYRKFTDYEWQITTESKVINGFTCYKALGKINYFIDRYTFAIEAWFCPEIPLPYGPDYYAGLPGLIFEVYRADGKDLHWKLKSIEKNKPKTFKSPLESDAISYQEYDKIYYNAIQEIMKK